MKQYSSSELASSYSLGEKSPSTILIFCGLKPRMINEISLQKVFTGFGVFMLSFVMLFGNLITPILLEEGMENLGLSQGLDEVKNSLVGELNSSVSRLESLQNRNLAELKVNSKFEGKYRNLINFKAQP